MLSFRSLVVATLVAATPVCTRVAVAQDQTLLHGGAGSVGLYAAPVVKLTELSNRSEVLGGVRAGVIFSRRFAVGLAAYHGGGGDGRFRDGPGGPLVDRSMVDGMRGPGGRGFGGNGLTYGGLELEYIWEPAKLVHASISSLFGGGTLRGLDGAYNISPVGNVVDYSQTRLDGRRSFFVAEPAANAEINIVKHVRLALGVGYRFTAGNDGNRASLGTPNAAGVTGSLSLKLGKL